MGKCPVIVNGARCGMKNEKNYDQCFNHIPGSDKQLFRDKFWLNKILKKIHKEVCKRNNSVNLDEEKRYLTYYLREWLSRVDKFELRELEKMIDRRLKEISTLPDNVNITENRLKEIYLDVELDELSPYRKDEKFFQSYLSGNPLIGFTRIEDKLCPLQLRQFILEKLSKGEESDLRDKLSYLYGSIYYKFNHNENLNRSNLDSFYMAKIEEWNREDTQLIKDKKLLIQICNRIVKRVDYLMKKSTDCPNIITEEDRKSLSDIPYEWIRCQISTLSDIPSHMKLGNIIIDLLNKAQTLPQNVNLKQLHQFYHKYFLELDHHCVEPHCDKKRVKDSDKCIDHVNSPTEECCVCFNENKMYFLSCTHKVCYSCVEKVDKCPICRTEIPDSSNISISSWNETRVNFPTAPDLTLTLNDEDRTRLLQWGYNAAEAYNRSLNHN